MANVITLGETMASFAPSAQGPLRYVPQYGIRTAGAESNVAVGLAKLGVSVAWVSRLGEDEFGHYVCNQIRSEGVDCSQVIFDREHRTGVMFKQTGAGETRVYYYRENSAASHMEPSDLRPELLRGAQILHLSGITPVLSESCRQTVLEALRLAREQGIMVSFDPNIRRKLWGSVDYVPLLRELTLGSEIVLLGLDEAGTLFSLRTPEEVFGLLFREGRARYVAVKDGGNGAWVSDGTQPVRLPPHPCRPIDPIGAGDGFNAGFLAGLVQNRGVVQAGRMGAVCGALATEVPGDVEGYPDAVQMRAILDSEKIIYR